MRRMLLNLAVTIALVLPLIAGSVWMYQASAGAFRFQHNVREAQNARGRLIRAFLATESDIRGFAATGDPYFARAYRARVRTFDALSLELENDLATLFARGQDPIVARERQTYARWNRSVAIPIVDAMGTRAIRALRVVDPAYAGRILQDDDELTSLLNDAAATSEFERQQLLRRILLASVALVASAATIVIVFLLRQASLDRERLKQTMLYDEERRVSGVLQSAFAPAQLPMIEHLSLNAIYVPATEERNIGGDWYDVIALHDGRVLMVIGDVAGHGLEAAVQMSRVRQALLAAAITAVGPAHILHAANRTLTGQSSGLVTAACCLYDPPTRRLSYASAGHPPPVIVPAAGEAFALPYGGPPLGLFEHLAWDESESCLTPGSMMILYTDGLIEEERDLVASAPSLLAAASNVLSAADPARAMFDALLPRHHPRDDVAILTMRPDGVAADRPATIGTIVADAQARSIW